MPYLRKRDTGAVTDWLADDSLEYQLLTQQVFPSEVSAVTPTGSGIISGETGGELAAGSQVWEEIAEEDAGFPDPSGGRVFVVALGAEALTGDTTTEVSLGEVGTAGTLTDVEYVPNAGITGVATNNRSITLNQVTVTGTSSPARAVTALAAITFGSGVNATANEAAALTISTAAFTATPPETLEVVSAHAGTGIADPGGVLYGVYTRS